MRILVISDEESPALWDHFDRRRLEGVDLILSCGDLDPEYLSFLVTFCHAPLLYVHGNHDDKYQKTPPGGCICVENRIHVCKGLRILGLGGSMRYKQRGEHQYTQGQMNRRVLKMTIPLLRHKGFDILLTHAPAYDLNDVLFNLLFSIFINPHFILHLFLCLSPVNPNYRPHSYNNACQYLNCVGHNRRVQVSVCIAGQHNRQSEKYKTLINCFHY